MIELAVQDDGVLLHRKRYDADRAWLDIVRLGATHVRVNAYSSDIARDGWAPLDRCVNECVAHGLAPQITISGQPRWSADAGEDPGGVPLTDPSPRAFASFADEVVGRYRGRCTRYALWNEPNHPAFLATVKPGEDALADLYAQLYSAGYAAARLADPDAEILWGELSGGDGAQAFLKRAVIRGGVQADGLAIHPYQFETAPIVDESGGSLRTGQLPYLADYLRRTSRIRTPDGAPVPIYVTELGWFRSGSRAVPEATRARWAVDALRICSMLGVRQMLVYHLVDAPSGSPWDSGIVSVSGEPSDTYKALRAELAAMQESVRLAPH